MPKGCVSLKTNLRRYHQPWGNAAYTGKLETGEDAVFPSKAAALASYAPRPPFKAFLAESLALYVEHGFITRPGVLSHLGTLSDRKP